MVATVKRIHTGGPFPFPRSDGAVFTNREGHLPKQRRAYYHEYTVITPGAQDRSMRRIVTGGTPLANPTQYFYTGDHYDSFCLVTPNWQCQLPGYPYAGDDPDGFLVRDEIVRYIDEYARSFGPPVVEGVALSHAGQPGNQLLEFNLKQKPLICLLGICIG